MEIQQQIKLRAKRNLIMSIVSWGVLASPFVTVKLMENYSVPESYLMMALAGVMVIILLLNLILFLWEFVQSIRISSQNRANENDPMVNIYSLLSMILAMVGALVSFFIYFIA